MLATSLRSDGRYRDKLYVDGGPSSTGTVGHVRMDGPEVFRHAVTNIAEVIDATLKKAGYQASDIDWFVPHQANKRILDGAARKLGLAPEKIVITVDKHANTSAASIPLALATGCARWAHTERGSRADGGHGWGLYLGGGVGPLVNSSEQVARGKPHFPQKWCNIRNLMAAAIDRVANARLASWIIPRPGGAVVTMSGKTLTRADLAEAVFQKVGLPRNESAEIVELVLHEIVSSLERGKTVKLSSFGSFGIRDKGQRIGRNPKTGQEVPITPRRVLVFRASNIMKQRINEALSRRKAAE